MSKLTWKTKLSNIHGKRDELYSAYSDMQECGKEIEKSWMKRIHQPVVEKKGNNCKMFSWCRAWIAKWFCFSIVAPKIKSKCWIHMADKDGLSDHDIWCWFTHCSIKRLDSCFIFCSNKTCFFYPFLIRGHFWCWVRRHCQSKFCKTWQSHCLF